MAYQHRASWQQRKRHKRMCMKQQRNNGIISMAKKNESGVT